MRQKKKRLLATLVAFTMMFASLSHTLPISVYALTENENNSTQENSSASDEITLLSDTTASIYVSSLGNDTNTGTKEAPYASLSKAIEAAKSGNTIYLLDDLELTETITVDKNVTIIGETMTNGKKPVLKLSDSKKYASIFKLHTNTTVTITGIAFFREKY